MRMPQRLCCPSRSDWSMNSMRAIRRPPPLGRPARKERVLEPARVDRARRQRRDVRARRERSRRSCSTPSTRRWPQRVAQPLERRRRGRGRERSPWRAASRSRARRSSPGSRRCRRARRCPPGRPSGRGGPGVGAKSRSGLSALIRASIAWPRISHLLLGDRQRRSPPAIRSCSRTTSTPVTISLTGCSTCRRALISRKRVRPALLVDEELAGRGAVVVERADQAPSRRRGSRRRSASARPGAGRLLDQLLVAALERAVAAAEVDHVAVRVGRAPGPRRGGPGARSARRRAGRRRTPAGPRRGPEAYAPASSSSAVDAAHPASAAAAGRLQQDRVADPRGDRAGLLLGLDDVGALADRDAELVRGGAGGGLVAAAPHRRGRRADERDPRLRAGGRQLRRSDRKP